MAILLFYLIWYVSGELGGNKSAYLTNKNDKFAFILECV